jgi:short-subunit dehydrogenase
MSILRSALGQKKCENLKCIVVTGASSGIGEATFKQFAINGFKAVGVARRGQKLLNICEKLRRAGHTAHWYECDLSNKETTQLLAEQILEEHGCPNGVVFNAGVSSNKLYSENTSTDRMHELALNYLSPSWMLDVFLPHSQKRGSGHFLAIGSLAACTSFPGNATYAASKAALAALWQSLEHEYAHSGISFSTVLPGLIQTEMSDDMSSWIPRRSADGVAELIYGTYEKPAMARTYGVENQAILAMTRLFPETTQNLITQIQSLIVPKRTKS